MLSALFGGKESEKVTHWNEYQKSRNMLQKKLQRAQTRLQLREEEIEEDQG